ncbi:MAG: type II toxin-antitoxin system RelE/ParE family toxin [Verrucomicrobiaceae bacterium]|nr:MAG: type II toxin-antitoxin system RelE/ParE family toxin [Verrucomicrobiaceae bacterium]
MRYRVVITAPADRNFRDHFQWIRDRSVQGADQWRARIIDAVRSLETDPERHALARESAAFPVSIRCLLVGKGRSAFRILFHVAGEEVRILAIRRPAQDLMNPPDAESGF